ncbi:hypothetical protein RYX36_005850 [Vicia faba]
MKVISKLFLYFLFLIQQKPLPAPNMTTISLRKGNTRLPPKIGIETNKDIRDTAFVVNEDIYDAKTTVDHLSGFKVTNRYLIVLYYQQEKMSKKFDQKKKEDEIARMQEKYGVSTKDK